MADRQPWGITFSDTFPVAGVMGDWEVEAVPQDDGYVVDSVRVASECVPGCGRECEECRTNHERYLTPMERQYVEALAFEAAHKPEPTPPPTAPALKGSDVAIMHEYLFGRGTDKPPAVYVTTEQGHVHFWHLGRMFQSGVVGLPVERDWTALAESIRPLRRAARAAKQAEESEA